MSQEQREILPYNQKQLTSIPEGTQENAVPPHRILRLTLSHHEPLRHSTQEIRDDQGNVIGISFSSSASFTVGSISGDVEDLTKEYAEKRGIIDPYEIEQIRQGFIAMWEKQEADEARKKQEQAEKAAREKAKKQTKAIAGSYTREMKGGRRFLHTSNVGIDLEQLFAAAANTVTQDESEVERLRSIFHEASVIIGGLETNGGGMSRKGDVLRPQGINLAPGEVYLPNLIDLNLPTELQDYLARVQIMLKYDYAWIKDFGWDPKQYKPKGSKIATFFLVAPNFDYETVGNSPPERNGDQVRWDEGRPALYVLESETYETYIKNLFKRNELPLIVSPRSLILSIRETNALRKQALPSPLYPHRSNP